MTTLNYNRLNLSLKIIQQDIEKFNPTAINVFNAHEFDVLGAWWREWDHSLSDKININFVLGGHELNDVRQFCMIGKVHQWSTYLGTLTAMFLNHNDVDLISSNTNFKYPFLSLNHNAHYHRCQLIDFLSRENLIESNAISWNRLENPTNYEWKYWNQVRLSLTDSFDGWNNMFTVPKEYAYSFFQLVPESTIRRGIVTEKTWIPLLLGKPFIALALPRYHKHLENLGFLLYDEIIDYKFDRVDDLTLRTNMIVENMKNISNNNLVSQYNQIKEKLEFNKNLALDIVTDYSQVPLFVQQSTFYQAEKEFIRSKDNSVKYDLSNFWQHR